MINIQLDKTVWLESDSNQYILKDYKDRMDSKGNQVYVNLGYYGTINGALKGYLNFTVRTSECRSIKELIALYERLEKHVDNLVREAI